MKTVVVHRRAIRQSPQKIRLVANLVKNKPVELALQYLSHTPKRAAKEVYKAIKSAQAAAVQKNLDSNRLIITHIVANQGPAFKRMLPGSRGRTYRIKKATSHVTVKVGDDTQAQSDPDKQSGRALKKVKNSKSKVNSSS